MKGNQSSIIGNMQMLMKQKKRETAFASKIKKIGACFLLILFFNHRRSNNHLHHHLRRHCRALPSFFSPLLPLLPQTCHFVPLVFPSPGCGPPSSAASLLLSVAKALPFGCSEEEVQKEVVVHG